MLDTGEIGGGKANGTSAFVAVNDLAGDGVGAAEEAGGIREIALENGLANARAADGRARRAGRARWR